MSEPRSPEPRCNLDAIASGMTAAGMRAWLKTLAARDLAGRWWLPAARLAEEENRHE